MVEIADTQKLVNAPSSNDWNKFNNKHAQDDTLKMQVLIHLLNRSTKCQFDSLAFKSALKATGM